MKTTVLMLIMMCFSFFTPAQTQPIKFPADFTLPQNEIPAGFEPKPIDEEARAAGMTNNPGFVNNPGFIQDIYEHIDPTQVKQVFVGIYQPKGRNDFDAGYYAIEYVSEKALQKEQTKIRKYNGARYFAQGKYLLQVWGDAGSFEDAVKHIATYFKDKLALKEFTPPAADETEKTDVSETVSPD